MNPTTEGPTRERDDTCKFSIVTLWGSYVERYMMHMPNTQDTFSTKT